MELLNSETKLSVKLSKAEFNVIHTAIRYMAIESVSNIAYSDEAINAYADILDKLDDIAEKI